jgi:hypothetical protein
MKCGEFIDQLKEYNLLRKFSTRPSYLGSLRPFKALYTIERNSTRSAVMCDGAISAP